MLTSIELVPLEAPQSRQGEHASINYYSIVKGFSNPMLLRLNTTWNCFICILLMDLGNAFNVICIQFAA